MWGDPAGGEAAETRAESFASSHPVCSSETGVAYGTRSTVWLFKSTFLTCLLNSKPPLNLDLCRALAEMDRAASEVTYCQHLTI